ncbi:hypothetical protein [Paraburkholderia adhaesiva]|uniref:hypothetical protein n=1 Tax=Paraburkholderia adhaesiva TaxID=2883244 RepID=UPI001F3AFB28|nr:hypothetical protein [Paraburkholderia adhaesiva]
MDFEFSWMTYFVSLFVLVVLSIALSLLCPLGGRRSPTFRDGAERRPDNERPR